MIIDETLEVIADQLLTLVPQRSGPNWIESIGANSLAHLINIAHEQCTPMIEVSSSASVTKPRPYAPETNAPENRRQRSGRSGS